MYFIVILQYPETEEAMQEDKMVVDEDTADDTDTDVWCFVLWTCGKEASNKQHREDNVTNCEHIDKHIIGASFSA